MMDVTVARDDLVAVLGRVVGVVEKRQTIPIFGNVLFVAGDGFVTVTGTDLEVEVQTTCRAKVLHGGEVTLPARKLADICRSLADGTEVRVKDSGDRCILTAERGRYILGTLPAQDFPRVDFSVIEESVLFDALALRRSLEKTWFAMAQQDVRYYLNGLLFDVTAAGMRSVCTDGHRLASYQHFCNLDIGSRRSVIIPFKTVTELRRQLASEVGSVKVDFGERLIGFQIGNTLMSSKLVDGRYPDYERVIPNSLTRVAVAEREALRRALARTSILSNEKFRGVKLVFEPGVLRLVAHNPEQEEAVEEIELEYIGDTVSVGFNVSYLSDLLGAVDCDTVEVRFEDADSSSLWRGGGVAEEIYVVMPMRL